MRAHDPEEMLRCGTPDEVWQDMEGCAMVYIGPNREDEDGGPAFGAFMCDHVVTADEPKVVWPLTRLLLADGTIDMERIKVTPSPMPLYSEPSYADEFAPVRP